MADEQDVLLREIDEELKQDRLHKLWKRYGNYVIAGAVSLVVVVAGIKGWQSYDLGNRMSQGERLDFAGNLANDGKIEDALSNLQMLSQDGNLGYSMLSRFRAAGLTVKRGDRPGAVKKYEALADDTKLDKVYRDLAVILGALQELGSDGRGGVLTKRATALATNEGPWQHNAHEVEAIAALAQGNRKIATVIFTELSNTAGAPKALRARAAEMLNILGAD